MKAFNGDIHIKNKLVELVEKFNIKHALETGTFRGHTAKELASIIPFVDTCENDPMFQSESKAILNDVENVLQHDSNSVDAIGVFADQIDSTVLFYLDSHWNTTPLLHELEAIGKVVKNPVIAIHDFQVPGTDLKYVTFDGQPYTLEWISPYLDAIYTDGYDYEYNSEAEGDRKGIIYITPKVWGQQDATNEVHVEGITLGQELTYADGKPVANEIIDVNGVMVETNKLGEVTSIDDSGVRTLEMLQAEYDAMTGGQKRSKKGKALKAKIAAL